VGQDGKELGGDQIQFTPAESPDERRYAGVTHLATLQSKGDVAVQVMELKSLLHALA
jgi:hypothetical protein